MIMIIIDATQSDLTPSYNRSPGPLLVNVVVLSDVVLFLQVHVIYIIIINVTIVTTKVNSVKKKDTYMCPQESNQKYTFVTPDGKPGAVPVHSLIAREKPGSESPKVVFS